MGKLRFGQFLVNNDIISEEILYHTLVEQKTRQDLISQIVIAEQVMTVEQVMDTFNHQPDTVKSFTEMALSLDYIQPAEADHVKALQRQSRPMIGDLLVEMGHIGRRKLDCLLEKYCVLPLE